MKTRVRIKFTDGTEKILNDVHVIVWDKANENEENDKHVIILFTDPVKGFGSMFAERDAIIEFDISLYTDKLYS